MKHHRIETILIASIVCTLFITGNYLHANWSNPTQDPPDGNIAPPINTSDSVQVKDTGGGIGADRLVGFEAIRSHDNVYADGNIGSESTIWSRENIWAGTNIRAANNVRASNNLLADNQVRSDEYCDRDGNNCTGVGGLGGGGDEIVYLDSPQLIFTTNQLTDPVSYDLSQHNYPSNIKRVYVVSQGGPGQQCTSTIDGDGEWHEECEPIPISLAYSPTGIETWEEDVQAEGSHTREITSLNHEDSTMLFSYEGGSGATAHPLVNPFEDTAMFIAGRKGGWIENVQNNMIHVHSSYREGGQYIGNNSGPPSINLSIAGYQCDGECQDAGSQYACQVEFEYKTSRDHPRASATRMIWGQPGDTFAVATQAQSHSTGIDHSLPAHATEIFGSWTRNRSFNRNVHFAVGYFDPFSYSSQIDWIEHPDRQGDSHSFGQLSLQEGSSVRIENAGEYASNQGETWISATVVQCSS